MSGLLTATSEHRIRSLAVSLREQGAPGTLEEITARVRRGALLALEPLPADDPSTGGAIRRIGKRLGLDTLG